LNIDKTLLSSAILGDRKSICDLMVTSNQSIEDILKVHETNNETILTPIIKNENWKLFRLLKSLASKEYFAQQLMYGESASALNQLITLSQWTIFEELISSSQYLVDNMDDRYWEQFFATAGFKMIAGDDEHARCDEMIIQFVLENPFYIAKYMEKMCAHFSRCVTKYDAFNFCFCFVLLPYNSIQFLDNNQ
jgi:hypothetical protein